MPESVQNLCKEISKCGVATDCVGGVLFLARGALFDKRSTWADSPLQRRLAPHLTESSACVFMRRDRL